MSHQNLCLHQRTASTTSAEENDDVQPLNDSLSSLESIGSWMRPMANPLAMKSPPPSLDLPVPKSPCESDITADHCVPPMTPHKTRRTESILKSPVPATPQQASSVSCCTSPSSSPLPLGVSPGRPPRPPLLKKRSRRGILRSTRASNGSRRSLLSSKSSHSSSSKSPGAFGRSRSFRRSKRPSPFKVKRVSFHLPDDSSVESSMDGSLLLCDVETMNNSSDELTLGGNELYHQSCRIVLPFMNGLDSEDEFELDENDDDGRVTESLDGLFNSTGDMAFSFDSFRADDHDFDREDFETPRRARKGTECLDAGDSRGYSGDSFDMKTPSNNSFPELPVVDDLHKTPVLSNLNVNFLDLDHDDDPKLPTLTPVPDRESSCESHRINKESPTSVVELDEAQYQQKTDNDFASQSDEDFISKMHQCTERFSSVKLATEDIMVRDIGQRAVTPSFELSGSDVHSSILLASSIATGIDRTASPLGCRHVALSPALSPKCKVNLNTVISPMGRLTIGGQVPSSPMGRSSPMRRSIATSPVGRIGALRPGRGL